MDMLGRTVLSALAAGDTLTLERVRLTASEHNDVVWPELPVARPEANFPVDYAWDNIERRNRRDLRRMLPWFAGRQLDHVGIACAGVEEFGTFRVHTGCVQVFRADGRGPLEAQLFKDVLERNGGYKIFRYDADRAPRMTALSPQPSTDL
jgi:hypothetical protein